MQSSERIYLSNLDHLRGFAAFVVFIWHFMHQAIYCRELCYQTEYAGLINLPFFTFLEQGHTGVALFFCISGYIFTRLAYGKKMRLGGFWKNRLLRLLPLLIFVGLCTFLARWASLPEPFSWPQNFRFFRPILHPGGSWTIYMELRYYIILPLILFCLRRLPPLPFIVLILLISCAYRFYLFQNLGTAQFAAYSKIAGRIDQFMCGAAVFYIEMWLRHHRPEWKRILRLAGTFAFLSLLAFYDYFSLRGGFYGFGGHPSLSPLWIFMPLIEGALYSLIIVGYLTLTVPRLFDRGFAALGRWSYSIYLNHFLMLPILIALLDQLHLFPEDFYGRLLVATLVGFPLIVAISALTYYAVERPFLRLRTPYLEPHISEKPLKSLAVLLSPLRLPKFRKST